MLYRVSTLGVLAALISVSLHASTSLDATTAVADGHLPAAMPGMTPRLQAGLCDSHQQPSTLVVSRTDVYRQPAFWSNTAPFKRTVADTVRVGHLYGSICRLQPVIVRDRSHPLVETCRSQGVVYHLGFWRDHHRLLLVSVDTGGCNVLFRGPIGMLGQRGARWPQYSLYTSPFWCRLAQVLRVSEYDLFPHEKGDKPTAEEQACKITEPRVDAQATPDGQTDRGTPSFAASLVE